MNVSHHFSIETHKDNLQTSDSCGSNIFSPQNFQPYTLHQ
jgi:hypothetical protein